MRWIALLFAPLLLAGQGTAVKDKPGAYEVQAALNGGLTLAADYLARSIPAPRGVLLTDRYIVVDVALFTAGLPGTPVELNAGQFALIVNGRQPPLLPQPPGLAGAALTYPDWNRQHTVEAAAGMGDTAVILGRPQPTARFPGDNRPQLGRVPNPTPRVPTTAGPADARTPDLPPGEVVLQLALPQGRVKLPISGLLFFEHPGKLTKIRTIDLIYTTPAATARLPLVRR